MIKVNENLYCGPSQMAIDILNFTQQFFDKEISSEKFLSEIEKIGELLSTINHKGILYGHIPSIYQT
jgi:acyl carrier protein